MEDKDDANLLAHKLPFYGRLRAALSINAEFDVLVRQSEFSTSAKIKEFAGQVRDHEARL